MELQDAINQELEENPALDLDEVQVCPLCGNPLTGRICLTCFGSGKLSGAQQYQDTEPLEGTSLMQRDDDDEEFDPIVRAEAEQTLAEYLSWNVRVQVAQRLHHVAEYLIGNLNDNGYLEGTVEDAAAATDVRVAEVEEVLRAIQSIEPWGLGARDTRECLIIQMDHLAESGESVPAHARAIVSDHFRELGEHKFGDIAQAAPDHPRGGAGGLGLHQGQPQPVPGPRLHRRTGWHEHRRPAGRPATRRHHLEERAR